MLSGITPAYRGTPAVANQIKCGELTLLEDKRNSMIYFLNRMGSIYDWRVFLCRLIHYRGPVRQPITQEIQTPNVESLGRKMIHPRLPRYLVIERVRRTIGRTMHEQNGAATPTMLSFRKALISQQNLVAIRSTRYPIILLYHLGTP